MKQGRMLLLAWILVTVVVYGWLSSKGFHATPAMPASRADVDLLAGTATFTAIVAGGVALLTGK